MAAATLPEDKAYDRAAGSRCSARVVLNMPAPAASAGMKAAPQGSARPLGVVLPSGDTVRTDGAWREALLGQLAALPCKVHVARVVGGERLPLSVAEKRRAFMATAAAAIDTESCAVAEAAMGAGLPFLVVRAIVDPAEEARPAAAIASLRADGGTRSLALAAHLVARPGEIAAMWRFAHSGRLALATLRQVVRLMPPPASVPAENIGQVPPRSLTAVN